jgi:hypothetical protein
MFFTKSRFAQRVAAFITVGFFATALLSMFAADPPPAPVDRVAHDPPTLAQNEIVSQKTNPIPQMSFEGGNLVATNQPGLQAAADTTGSAVPKPTPSQSVTINLIHRLVQRGVLTQEDADELINQAEEDAVIARTLAAKERTHPSRPEESDPSLITPEPPLLTTTPAATTVAPPADGIPEREALDEEDAVRVTYVPEVVKQQLRDEIRQEVMEQAREENWAAPRSFPAWATRITPFADIRIRYEGIFFPDGNDDTGAFPSFNAINTGAPFDVTGTTFSPQLNANQDRERFRLRVRVGAEMDLENGFTMGLRLATGDTDTPVSPNQSFGTANGGQGGDFSKYQIWLDRAFLRYETGGTPSRDFQVNLGRFDNPFFTTSGIMWYEDLGFDGLAISGRYRVHEGVTPFAVVGGFPIFNTELNFSSNRPDKFSSEDKYLFAGQLGTNLRFNKDFSATIAGAYYHFENVEGKLSDPFVPLTASDQGNTDDSRPSFAQNGNTYFPIRDIIPTADNGFGTTNQFQYFGLATPFRVVDFDGKLDYAHFDPFHLSLFGAYLNNVAFNWQDINSKAINNRGPNQPNGKPGTFAGGNIGWIVGLKAGTPAFEKLWDWNVGISYRYVESDATVDGFVDSDFGGNFAGTNLKGYTLFGSLALSSRTSIFLRWMSADEIGGPTLRNDILQFDFNAKF